MSIKKVKLAFIENNTQRKTSYRKRQKGFLKKANELNTRCDEMAIVVYSSYHDEPQVFPNHDKAINTFTKFKELSVLKKSKNMVTQEEFTKQRIKKMEEQLQKVKKKNRVQESTNKIYDMLNGKDISANMHLCDLNDLSYVINQNLKQVCEAIKIKIDGEGSTLNAPQPIAELMVPSGTNSEGPKTPLLAPVGAPVSMVPLMSPSTVFGGTNSEGPRAPLLVPVMTPISMVPPAAPLIVPSAAPTQVSQPMFHLMAPLMTLPPTVPLVDLSWVSPSPDHPLSFSSQIFPPMVSQMYPPIPLHMDLRRPPGMAPSIPPTITMVSPIPSSMMAPPMSAPMFPSMISQVDPSMNIPQMDVSMSMNNYQNYFDDFSQNLALPEMLDWNDDDIMTLFDDSSFNYINVQAPNLNNNF